MERERGGERERDGERVSSGESVISVPRERGKWSRVRKG